MRRITLRCQKGAALILITFLLALVATTYVLYGVNSSQYLLEKDVNTAKALSDAKAALIGWAVLQNTPGQLPCPEDTSLIGLPTEGSAQSSCVLPAIGRLPWRTIGIGDIRDGNGDKLWYVISKGFRNAPINSNSVGQLTVNGISNSAVAIIFSVGTPLSSQTRPAPSSSSPPNVNQYLDGANNDGDNVFISGVATALFNDEIIVLTQNELFSEVSQRVLRMIRGDASVGLMGFYVANNKYPYADVDGDGYADSNQLSGSPSYQGLSSNSLSFSSQIKSTLTTNNWFPLVSYQVSANQQNVTLLLNGKPLVVP